MKKIFSLFLAGMAFMSITSCSDSDYDEKYAKPSTTQTVGVPQVFTSVLYKGNTWMNLVYYRYYTQSSTSGLFGGVVGDDNTRGRFMGAGEGRYNDRWKNFYDMVTQYRLLEYTYNNLSKEEQPANAIFYYLGRSLVEAQLHEVLSLWGDVPFNGTGTLWMNNQYDEAKKKCVYDDDVELYKQILNNLKEAGDYLAGSLNSTWLSSLKRQDYTLANGDQLRWRKYVNSLRLRIALHLATNGDCVTEARNAIKEILENPTQYPLIDNNSENMGVAADTQTDDFNYGKTLSQALHTGNMAVASQTILKALKVPSNGIPDGTEDPRLQVMYDCNPDGEYIAFDVHMTSAQITELNDNKKKAYTQRGMSTASYFCRVDSQAVAGKKEYEGNENIQSIWINAAEVSLSKAEAYLKGYGVAQNPAQAESFFKQGVKQSVEFFWNMKEKSSMYKEGNDSENGFRRLVKPSDADINTYINNIWDETEETVCTQLWLNFSYMNELEAWNVVRRTGYPVVEFSRDSQVSNYPTPPNRLPYPSDERTYNSENCQKAIETNYEEETGYYTNLFWAKKDYYKLIN